MNAKEAIKTALTSTQGLVRWYLSDLTDTDLLVRPVPGANHIAWQLGHLIVAEPHLVREEIPGAAYPELPAGFAEQHHVKTAGDESTQGFGKKADYLALFNKVREDVSDRCGGEFESVGQLAGRAGGRRPNLMQHTHLIEIERLAGFVLAARDESRHFEIRAAHVHRHRDVRIDTETYASVLRE